MSDNLSFKQMFTKSLEFPLSVSLCEQAHYFRETIIASRDLQNTIINFVYPNNWIIRKPEAEIIAEFRNNTKIICKYLETLEFRSNDFLQNIEFANQKLTEYSQNIEESERPVFINTRDIFLFRLEIYWKEENSKLQEKIAKQDQEDSEKCLENYIINFRKYCKKKSVKDLIQSVICQSRDQSLDSIIASLISQLKKEIIENNLTIQQIKSMEYYDFVKRMRPIESRKHDLFAQKTEIWREFIDFVKNN